jgi:hypothetical protein
VRLIRHKDLLSRYDFVVVKTKEGERECHPRDVKPGEVVELPINDGTIHDYALFRVLADLPTPAGVVEMMLSEISMNPHFARADDPFFQDDEVPSAVDQEVAKEFEQEELWVNLAAQAGLDSSDFRSTAQSYGITSPPMAIDMAEQAAGNGFPKRGSWSGELVWIFLSLRDREIIDSQGAPL